MTDLIKKTIAYVQSELQDAEAGHDWFHILRVWKNAKRIAETETCHVGTVELAALLHDIADPKFHGGDESIGPRKARSFLESQNVDRAVISHVVAIIENMSFKNSFGDKKFHSKELDIVQDADRLDAIGAIGIARAFHYGGFKNRPLYDPDIAPNLSMTKDEYKNSVAPTINHFYEKLLLLKDRMNTETAGRIAGERHAFMEGFLDRFKAEWNGEI
jgi:uncharacterized protein